MNLNFEFLLQNAVQLLEPAFKTHGVWNMLFSYPTPPGSQLRQSYGISPIIVVVIKEPFILGIYLSKQLGDIKGFWERDFWLRFVLMENGVSRVIKTDKSYPPYIMHSDTEVLVGRPGNYLALQMKNKEANVQQFGGKLKGVEPNQIEKVCGRAQRILIFHIDNSEY